MTARVLWRPSSRPVAAECDRIFAAVEAATGRSRAELEEMSGAWLLNAYVKVKEAER